MSAPPRYKSCARGEFRKGYELLRIRKRIVFLSSQKTRFGFCDGNNEPSAIEVQVQSSECSPPPLHASAWCRVEFELQDASTRVPKHGLK
ncbi:hypothetical protein NC652_037889 [Populus alba x Populus x berolinensis]|nr:hypothetical protein NC652_037889 [Populus alba x Populus x berolinensis]